MRVLVADDDMVYRTMLEELLTKWHLEPVLARDGLEAMAVMEGENPPQLVVLDWEMPGMDGFEVARTIRGSDLAERTYVLMITGSRRKPDLMKVLVCGADDFLIKPFEPLDLQIHLRSAMRIVHLQEELDQFRQTVRRGAPGAA